MRRFFQGIVIVAVFALFGGCNATVRFNTTSDPSGATVHSKSTGLLRLFPKKQIRGVTPLQYDVNIWGTDQEYIHVVWPDGTKSLEKKSTFLCVDMPPYNWHFPKGKTAQPIAPPVTTTTTTETSTALTSLEQGQELYKKEEYHAALPFLKKAAKESPDHWNTYHWLGWCYYRINKYEDAIAQLKISQVHKNFPGTLDGLGLAYYALKNHEEALRYFSKWSDLEPKKPGPYNNIAWCYNGLGRYNDAVTHFKIAGKLDEKALSYIGLGTAYKGLGRFDEAKAVYKTALNAATEEQKWSISIALADCYVATGDYGGARKILGDRPVLGLTFRAEKKGLYIESVMTGWPAEKGGIQEGDIMTRFRDHDLAGVSSREFSDKIIGSTSFGSIVPIKILRDGRSMTAKVQLGITEALARAEVTAGDTEPGKEDESKGDDGQRIRGKRWAVVVGISDYKDTRIPALRYASSDAQAFNDWLISPKGGRYAPSQVKLLTDKQATSRNVKNALFVWLKQAIEEDVVIIYFAGHGSPESPDSPENLYLLTHDTDYSNIASSAFPMWDVETALKRFIKAKRVVVLADACHSGGVGNQFDIARRSSRGLKSNSISSGIQGLSQVADGVCVISASDDKQMSREGKGWGGGHGVFTFYLIKGLKGEADYTKDAKVTLGELTSYLSENVRRATKNAQSPTVAGKYDPALTIKK